MVAVCELLYWVCVKIDCYEFDCGKYFAMVKLFAFDMVMVVIVDVV